MQSATLAVDLAIDLGEALTDKQHEAVMLRAAGYKQREVAEQLGISDRAVRYRLSNAKSAMMGLLFDLPKN